MSKGDLARNQEKSIQTDRVVLVPGPTQERAVVAGIYVDFVRNHLGETEIAVRLNKAGIFNAFGSAWTRRSVHRVLINEKYIGNNVWNHRSCKLRRRRAKNASELWIRLEGAFPAIIGKPLFDAAQEIIRSRARRATDDEFLQKLRNLLHTRILFEADYR